jgi:hypothetical protein
VPGAHEATPGQGRGAAQGRDRAAPGRAGGHAGWDGAPRRGPDGVAPGRGRHARGRQGPRWGRGRGRRAGGGGGGVGGSELGAGHGVAGGPSVATPGRDRAPRRGAPCGGEERGGVRVGILKPNPNPNRTRIDRIFGLFGFGFGSYMCYISGYGFGFGS